MRESLAFGKRGEAYAKSIFMFAGCEVEYNNDESKLEEFDLSCKLGRKKFTAEIKYDAMAEKTGNIALEFYNSKSMKPSGIDGTKADLWGHVLQDGSNKTLWVCSTRILREWIKKNKAWRTLNDVGDDNACIYLYKEADILGGPLVRLDNLEQKYAKKLLREILK